MSDTSGQPPADGEEGTAKDPEFRDDALSELMTGAYAATSMVAMGVKSSEGDLPAPPVWAPREDPPRAEGLDRTSGAPAQIPSGPHYRVEADIEIAADFDQPEPDEVSSDADAVEPRASEAVTVPLWGPSAVGTLGPPSVDIPISSDDYPVHPGYDDEGEGAASISTDSGVVVTPKHAQGARLTGAYPTISPQLRSPSPKRETSTMPWIVGGAALVGLVAVGIVVMMSGGGTTDVASLAAPAEAPSNPSGADIVPTQTPTSPEPAQPEAADAPAPTTPELVDPEPPSGEAPPPATAEPDPTYAAALAHYEADPTKRGLLKLTLTACSLGLGPDARTAFHKLIGGKARSKAVVKCREAGIDVTSKIEGHTGPEIASQARAALDEGRATEALALAKQSNRTERNGAALELMVLAHCELKHKRSAKKLLRHIPERDRAAIIRDCSQRGVKLRR